MVVSEGEYVAAVVWAHWMPGAPGVLEWHFAAAKEYRSRWITKGVLDAVFQIVPITGCKTISAQVMTPTVHRILVALGFSIHGGLATLNVEDWHGKPQETS